MSTSQTIQEPKAAAVQSNDVPTAAAVAQRFTFQTAPHGSGGFARVIRGRDNVLERDIAVKVLDPLATKFEAVDQDRFRREAKILAKLSHPSIPAIYDVQFNDKHFLIVFQFVEGKTLRELLDADGPCDLTEARRWFLQIASALEHAHALGVIHRDIKPANIIVTPNREAAYLVDFGIALTADDARRLTQSGYAIGTPGYMSPEQQAGKEVDHKTDFYSLGVTLYEALAGAAIPVGNYEDLAARDESVPPQIDELIQGCLAPKDQRIASARDFSRLLEGALRPLRPISEVLAHGRLHELASAIEELSADEFARLPAGQLALIVTKVTDLVGSGEESLDIAAARLLEILVPRGIHLATGHYREIVRPAIEWAFRRRFRTRLGVEYLGRDGLRRELEKVSSVARTDSHQIICEEFLSFLKDVELTSMEDWYLHAVRQELTSLMANPACRDENAAPLAEMLKVVNQLQRSR